MQNGVFRQTGVVGNTFKKMKKTILTVILFILLSSVYGQDANKNEVWPGEYFNNFQKYSGRNIDSSIYYARLLAANKNYNFMLQDLLHNSFAQSFRRGWETEIKDSVRVLELKKQTALNKQILNRMITDSIQRLVTASMPIFYWAQVQQYENNSSKLKEITNDFIKNQLSSDDIYDNRVGRYALLIHQIISNNTKLKALSNKLFIITQNKLKSNSIMNADADTLSKQALEKRSWYRYLYAYCNYTLANQALKKNNVKDAGKYFLTAYEYSPDKFDRINYSSYFYDMFIILRKEKNSFKNDYVNYLKQYSSNKEDILERLLSSSLIDPTFKKELKTYYIDNFSGREPFSVFWQKNINRGLKIAPAFSILKMNGENFSLKEKQGKWILLDFWGTWCGPCRAEHPDLQKLYTNLSKSKPNFELLTIACRDDSTKVKDYMKEKLFDFPVAMSDNKIEKTYPVDGYPSKFLITPEGNFLTIPLGIDWVDFITNYIE